MIGDLDSALSIATAALCGAAVGVEREWSGHAAGPSARLGGVRTITLLGGLAGAAGRLAAEGQQLLAGVIVLGAAALIVAAYVAASRKEIDATTEVAAFVVLIAGVLAGLGHRGLASGISAITILLLVEKRRLHAWVGLIEDAEIRAGARFAVMGLVVLPLLPEGPFGPLGGIRPRELWALVLLFSGLSFAGTVIRRLVGGTRGYTIAGAVGGLISSTAVTLSFARMSAARPALAAALASGVAAAAAVMIGRVLLLSAVLSPRVGVVLLPLLALPLAVGAVLTLLGLRRASSPAGEIEVPSNPLELRRALQMALLFQVVLYLVHATKKAFGDAGLFASAALVGLTDVDAIVLAMARRDPQIAGETVRGLVLLTAVLSNTMFKLGMSVALGKGRFRMLAVGSLGAIAVACALPLVLRVLR